MLELSNGQILIAHQDGTMRLFEIRLNELELQHKSWANMLMGINNPASKFSSEHSDNNSDFDSEDTNENNENETDGDGQGEGQGSGGVGGVGSGGEKGRGNKGRGGRGGKGGGGGGGGTSLNPENFNMEQSVDLKLSADPKDLTNVDNSLSMNEIMEAAREAVKLMQIKEIDSTKTMGFGEELYKKLYDAVKREISQLRMILESAEAKEKERTWLKNQVHGELDDAKLVDGATGEKNIYKRRGNEQPMFGNFQKLPKRIKFVIDISRSMRYGFGVRKRGRDVCVGMKIYFSFCFQFSHFNGVDRRLDRTVAATVMILESFRGFSHKYDISIVGHDGESPVVPLVHWGKFPSTMKERLRVIDMMYYNALYCASGDNTLAAVEIAVQDIVKQPADDYFVFALSGMSGIELKNEI